MSKRAILVVDLQNEYWPGGNLPLHGIDAAAANAARVMAHARAKGDLVVNIRHEAPARLSLCRAAKGPGSTPLSCRRGMNPW